MLRGMLQLSGPSLVKWLQQVLSIYFGPKVTLANLLSLAVASADGGKADGKRGISEAVAILKSDPMVPLTPTPTCTGFLQCHVTPEPLPPCPFYPSEHLVLPSLDLGGGSGWHTVGSEPAPALQAE